MPKNKRVHLSGAAKRKKLKAEGKWDARRQALENKANRAKQKRAYQRRHKRGSALIDEYKLKMGCADCGYKAHRAALQFDHLPGSIKLHTIARLRDKPNTAIREMEKCEVVCANCHAIRTFERRYRSH